MFYQMDFIGITDANTLLYTHFIATHEIPVHLSQEQSHITHNVLKGMV